MSPSQDRLQTVLDRIAQAEIRGGRKPGSVSLIAVSKTKTAEAVITAAKNGAVNFGENYVQEALRKIEKVRENLGPHKIHWHFIGALQTNKSKLVVGVFDTIQSVDRFDLAKALNTRAIEAGIVQNIFLQVKLGDEPSKMGAPIAEVPALLKQILELKNLRIQGLMSLPPIEAEPESSRKYFKQLRECRDSWASLIPPESGKLSELSMGTTHDFEVAIEEGATMVRVGTAIFGAREKTVAH